MHIEQVSMISLQNTRNKRATPMPNAPINVMPHYPRAGSVGGFVGDICWRTPRGGRGLVVITFRESACNAHAYIPCGHSEWTSRTRYLLVHLQTLFGSKLSASMVALLYVAKTKVSDFFSRIASSTCRLAGDCLF